MGAGVIHSDTRSMSDGLDQFAFEPGAVADGAEEETLRAISQAFARHADAVCDGARVIVEPLSRSELVSRLNLYDHAAAYVVVSLDALFGKSEGAFRAYLAQRLSTELPISNVRYEVVWGGNRSLLMYVRGDVATGNP